MQTHTHIYIHIHISIHKIITANWYKSYKFKVARQYIRKRLGPRWEVQGKLT